MRDASSHQKKNKKGEKKKKNENTLQRLGFISGGMREPQSQIQY